MKLRRFFLLSISLLFFSCAFFSCASSGKYIQPENDFHSENYIPEIFEWKEEPQSKGTVSSFYFENKNFPVKYFIFKIDLYSPFIEIKIFPQELPEASFFKSTRTKKTAENENLFLAINFTPFKKKNFISSKVKLAGLQKNNGKVFSKGQEKYCAFAFEKRNNNYAADFFESQTSAEIENFSNALGGFFLILKDGKKLPFKVASHDARIALGLDKEKRFLFILAVESSNKSMGLSFQECAELLLHAGCTDAMQADGGSSSEAVLKGKSLLDSFYTRPQANTLGILVEENQN